VIFESIFLVLILISFSSIGIAQNSNICSQHWNGAILYVGGNGPNNYTRIQDAISDSEDKDIIFVYDDSSPYYEHITIDKSIYLIGENKTTTVIDGENIGDVVMFSADNITLQGFTIRHSGDTPKTDAGIESKSNGNKIFGNSIVQNGRYAIGIFLNGSSNTHVSDNFISENGNEGIFLEKSTHCIIQGNIFTQNGHCAIVVSRSRENTIVDNVMYNNYAGVSLWPDSMENEIAHNLLLNQQYSGVGVWPGANDNDIHHNNLSNNSLYGIIITRALGTNIAHNIIQGSNEGCHFDFANRTIISFNNFLDNNHSACFTNSSLNRWKQNYWDEHPWIWPKCIMGTIRVPWNKTRVIPWINLDWFPATKPYNLPFVGDEIP